MTNSDMYSRLSLLASTALDQRDDGLFERSRSATFLSLDSIRRSGAMTSVTDLRYRISLVLHLDPLKAQEAKKCIEEMSANQMEQGNLSLIARGNRKHQEETIDDKEEELARKRQMAHMCQKWGDLPKG